MTDPKFSTKPLGQILVEAGIISIGQIEIALQEQKFNDLRIGEILVLHGWVEQQTVDFFAERWQELPQEEKKQPLASYFQEAGLLDSQQIKAILRLQQLKEQKVRFHRLAVEQGYLKQITVDCFVAHVLKAQDYNSKVLAKTYAMLTDYANGKKDFAGVRLPKAPWMGICLQRVKLDGSNLSKADLSKADLSHSSLIETNLTRVNLAKSNLTGANLSKTQLTEANLRDARLAKTNFSSAILQRADFRGAHLAEANFSGAQLQNTMLPLHYSYQVYYDRNTSFDKDFDPQFMGWKLIESEDSRA